MKSFQRICFIATVARCYNSGYSVKEIAKEVGKSASTIYRYLHIAGVIS